MSQDKQVAIVVLVSFVAVLSLISAGNLNSTGSTVQEPVFSCAQDTYCLEWEWTNVQELVCQNFELMETKECSTYAVQNGELICDSWNTIYDNQCTEWGLEDNYERVCLEEKFKEECFLS